MNREYHKEMFLGEEHEEFKSHPVDRAEGRLKEIVAKYDQCSQVLDIDDQILLVQRSHVEL